MAGLTQHFIGAGSRFHDRRGGEQAAGVGTVAQSSHLIHKQGRGEQDWAWRGLLKPGRPPPVAYRLQQGYPNNPP